jgi:serine/threonine-protein kinase
MSDRYEGGKDKVLGRRVVVRKIEGPLAARLKEEASAAAAVTHPNIVSILDLGEDQIVYEWLEGATIRERLAQGPITALEIAKIATELGGALQAIHEAELTHGDVRPENVLLTKNGARLAAFGVPTEGKRSAAIDQRALAATLYEAFSGKAPPSEGTPQPLAELADDIRARVLRARVDAALSRAFGGTPYANCRELGTMVAGAIDPPYSGAFPALRQAEMDVFASHTPSIVPRPTRRIQNILAGLAVVLIALLIIFGRQKQRDSAPPPPPPASTDAGIDGR